MPRPSRKPAELWEDHKDLIHTYYIVENRSLKEVMELLKTKHNFNATKREFVKRLESWRMSKYLKKADWQHLHQRTSDQKESIVHVTDVPIEARRLRRGISRYRSHFARSHLASLPNYSPSRGITIRTPSPEPRIQLSFLTIPWFFYRDNFGCYVLSMVHEYICQANWISSFGTSSIQYSSGELSVRNARSLLLDHLKLRKTGDDFDAANKIVESLEVYLPRRSSGDVSFSSKEPFFLLVQCCIYSASNNLISLRHMDRFIQWILESGTASLFNQFIGKSKNRSHTMKIFLSRLLLSAVSLGKKELVSTLLQKGVDPNCGSRSETRSDETALKVCVDEHIHPLQLAVIRNRPLICSLLLKYNADPDSTSRHMPLSPLALAISIDHGNSSLCNMLIASGAFLHESYDYDTITRLDFCKPDSRYFHDLFQERTLLIQAVEVQNIEIVHQLLMGGAKVNRGSPGFGTPLQTAVMKNDLSLVNYLLEAGAEVNMLYNLEMLAKRFFLSEIQDRAREPRRHACHKWLSNQQQRSKLSCPVFEISAHRNSFLMPIQIAAKNDDARIVQRLLQAGATVHQELDWESIRAQFPFECHDDLHRELYHLEHCWREESQTVLHECIANGNVELTRILLEHGANIDATNGLGWTPLQFACGLGRDIPEKEDKDAEYLSAKTRRDLVQLLLCWDSDVNAPPGTVRGRTALQAAAEAGDIFLVKLLIDKGADMNAPPSYCHGLTALEAAARAGRIDLIRLLLDHGAESGENILWLALHGATTKGNTAAVEQLLSKDVDVNVVCSSPRLEIVSDTLLQAAVRGGHISVVRTLLEAGADIELRVDQQTPLCSAAKENNPDMLEYLLLHKANPSPKDTGVTPLATAAAMHKEAMVHKLLVAGAEVNQLSLAPVIPGHFELHTNKTHITATPLFWALSQYIFFKPIEEREQEESRRINIALLLLSYGADPNAKPAGESSVMGIACEMLNHLLVRRLIEYGGHLNTPSTPGKFPIHIAAESGRTHTVQLLLDAGADAKVKMYGEDTPDDLIWMFKKEEITRMLINAGAGISKKGTLLVQSIYFEYYDLAYTLIEEGADVNCVSEYAGFHQSAGHTALQMAVYRKHIGLTHLLLDRGANVNALAFKRHGLLGTAIQLAAAVGDFNITKLLLERGAAINILPISTLYEGTALQIAANCGHLDIVHLLLENDEEKGQFKSRCEDAAGYALLGGHDTLAQILRSYISKAGLQI